MRIIKCGCGSLSAVERFTFYGPSNFPPIRAILKSDGRSCPSFYFLHCVTMARGDPTPAIHSGFRQKFCSPFPMVKSRNYGCFLLFDWVPLYCKLHFSLTGKVLSFPKQSCDDTSTTMPLVMQHQQQEEVLSQTRNGWWWWWWCRCCCKFQLL